MRVKIFTFLPKPEIIETATSGYFDSKGNIILQDNYKLICRGRVVGIGAPYQFKHTILKHGLVMDPPVAVCRDSFVTLYKRLLAFRNNDPEITVGMCKEVDEVLCDNKYYNMRSLRYLVRTVLPFAESNGLLEGLDDLRAFMIQAIKAANQEQCAWVETEFAPFKWFGIRFLGHPVVLPNVVK